MRHPHGQQPRSVHFSAYREAFERLDEALQANTRVSQTERLQLIRRRLFGELPEEPDPNDTVTNLQGSIVP